MFSITVLISTFFPGKMAAIHHVSIHEIMAKFEAAMDPVAQLLLNGEYSVNLTLNQRRTLSRQKDNHKIKGKLIITY